MMINLTLWDFRKVVFVSGKPSWRTDNRTTSYLRKYKGGRSNAPRNKYKGVTILLALNTVFAFFLLQWIILFI